MTHMWKEKENYPVLAHQELLKIPLYPLETEHPRNLRLHPLVQRLSLITVHIGLAQHREGDPVVGQAERLNSIIVSRVLLHELVAREPQDDKVVWVIGFDLFVELLKTFELGREATLGRGVDD